MRNCMAALAALCLVVSGSATALAGPASERVFSRAALVGLGLDTQAVYSHVREGSAGEALMPIEDGEIRIAIRTGTDGTREAAVTMGTAGELRPVSVWPASSGNPIVPIFLESALRTMARVTGGSAFYIRNRMKEALGARGRIEEVEIAGATGALTAQHIVFTPFADDQNRARMGAFADLTLHFTVSDAVPGDIVRFMATTGGETGDTAYRETITFVDVTGEN